MENGAGAEVGPDVTAPAECCPGGNPKSESAAVGTGASEAADAAAEVGPDVTAPAGCCGGGGHSSGASAAVATGASETAVASSASETADATVAEKREKKKKEKAEKKDKKLAKADAQPAQGHKVAKEGIEVSKSKDFGGWFKEVIIKSELIEYYDISGCYILRPRSFSIWETIQRELDGKIKEKGVQNCYFPIFVSSKALQREKDHVEGFQAEVAWVTKSGNSDLEDPIAVRPTSETIMYPLFSKWVRSHRDLPLKVNQWSNVVRWEMSQCTPFLRSREFLWQEGHTAHATKEQAAEEVYEILDLYKYIYEDLLAVPVIRGTKTETEKFAGALFTTTVEGFIPGSGRAIQGATSHCLGQNFARMFEITFEDENRELRQVWQNSWGLTTRTIGVMIMVHSDDKGLVVPPRVAPLETVVVPIWKKQQEGMIQSEARKLGEELRAGGITVEVDDRVDKTPGWKFNQYERNGVPLRLELGPRDIENGKVLAVRRDTGEKLQLDRKDVVSQVKSALADMQVSLLQKARDEYHSRVRKVSSWSEFMAALRDKCVALCPFCDLPGCEESIKKRSKKESEGEAPAQSDGEVLSGHAKSLCIPFETELEALGMSAPIEGCRCFCGCNKPAKVWCLFGRSY